MTSLFTPIDLGPITVANCTVRSAAFEGMCPDGMPSASLLNYHKSVAKGAVGMTTVACVSVNRGGCSFQHQAQLMKVKKNCQENLPIDSRQ